jgi:sugar/nucleoside kinase (ribokinase family)
VTVLTVGETMALLDPVEDGRLGLDSLLRLRIAGAESNVAIALARLGVDVAWVSRLGSDSFGDLVADTLVAQGVDIRYVRREADAPTGLYFKWRQDGRTSVSYYRHGAAAARLRPEDVPDRALDGVSLIHLTGITIAIGAGDLVLDLARRGRERGATVMFDPNFRAPLWRDPAAAAEAQAAVLPYVDWYLCGEQEGCGLFDVADAEAVIEQARAAGARAAVVRVGARGAVVHDGAGSLVRVPPPRTEAITDEIGAGDAFAAGFAYGLLQGWPTTRCAHAGNVVAGRVLLGSGDWETLPHLGDIRADLHAPPVVEAVRA